MSDDKCLLIVSLCGQLCSNLRKFDIYIANALSMCIDTSIKFNDFKSVMEGRTSESLEKGLQILATLSVW